MDQLLRPEIPLKGGPPAVKPRILIAPLDWGLGHTTRCIPVIRELLAQDCEVYLAGDNRQARVLLAEFPDLVLLPLKGYNIKYARSAIGLLQTIVFQIPKILRSIRREQDWLISMTNQYVFNAVISDNRYGLHHPGIPCVFITHQLAIKSSMGKWTEKKLQKRNYSYINRFSECWIPDVEGENNLAGELSHPLTKPEIPVRYIGPLSRLEKKEIAEKKNHLLIVLSGPEPQRSILEEIMIKEISHYHGTAVIVRGLPDTKTIIPSTNMIEFHNHMSAQKMNEAMMKAEYVIGRSGYSTIMDVVALQKKSILIPTPGQSEQEYLGKYLEKKKMTVCISQNSFSLSNALALAENTSYSFPEIASRHLLKKTIEQFLNQLCRADLG